MSTPAVLHRPNTREPWTQPPTLTFTSSDPEAGFDPSSAYHCTKPEPEHDSPTSARLGDSATDGPTPVPRGHRLAWTIPSRIVQPPSIPALSQISISLSTLSFTRSPRSKPSPSTLLSSSPSTPAALSSGTTLDQQETPTKSAPSSHFLRTPSPYLTDHAYDWSNNDHDLTHRTSANPPSATPPQSRRSTFTTTTAAFFTSMSRPSWDPFPLITSTSSQSTSTTSASVSPNTTSAPNSIISNPNPISIEDARLLDPSYLSSVPIPSHSGCSHGHSALGTGVGINHTGGPAYTHAIPYVDPQGTLHDPDYRPFPLIRQTKRSSPSPFAIRKPYYWEMDDDDDELESDLINNGDDDDDDTEGSTPTTPTSTTPFICYFLETHPLKRRGSPFRNIGSPSKNQELNCDRVSGRTKRSKGPGGLHGTRSQLKLGTAYMYATIATGLGGGNRSQYSPTTPTTPRTATPLPIPQYTSTLSTSPPATVEDVHHGKEKKGWGLLWKSGNRKDSGAE